MISEWVFSVGVLVLCVLLVPYVLGPILVFFSLRFRMPPNIVAVDPRVHPLPAEARSYLADTYRELTADGFELAGTMFLPDLVPNVKALFAIYANRATSDMAMSTIMVAQSGTGGEVKKSYVEFVRRYDDDVVVQTNNSSELSSFKRMPGEFTTKFWQVQDIRRMFGLHQRLCERFRQRGQPTFRLDSQFGGDPLQYVAKAVLEETFREQVGTGYLSEGPNGFRPTVKGAWIMAWQELWPVKGIRRGRERRNADRLLAELEGG